MYDRKVMGKESSLQIFSLSFQLWILIILKILEEKNDGRKRILELKVVYVSDSKRWIGRLFVEEFEVLMVSLKKRS